MPTGPRPCSASSILWKATLKCGWPITGFLRLVLPGILITRLCCPIETACPPAPEITLWKFLEMEIPQSCCSRVECWWWKKNRELASKFSSPLTASISVPIKNYNWNWILTTMWMWWTICNKWKWYCCKTVGGTMPSLRFALLFSPATKLNSIQKPMPCLPVGENGAGSTCVVSAFKVTAWKKPIMAKPKLISM